jgi:hypothetical protein
MIFQRSNKEILSECLHSQEPTSGFQLPLLNATLPQDHTLLSIMEENTEGIERICDFQLLKQTNNQPQQKDL